jgi:hypothetical protein
MPNMSYLDIGYNEFLQIKEPLSRELDVSQSEQFIQSLSGEKIITEIAGDLIGQGINADNITTGEMSFDRARGGMMKLGGENNQNGEFALYDENGLEKILMDKDGMQIMNGAMIIKDTNGRTIVDGSGLVSESNFANTGAAITNVSSQEISSNNTLEDVTGAKFNFILKRRATILIFGHIVLGLRNGSVGDYKAEVHTELHRDGTNLTRTWVTGGVDSDGPFGIGTFFFQTIPILYIGQLDKGQHVIQLKAEQEIVTGTPILKIQEWRLSYIILGT